MQPAYLHTLAKHVVRQAERVLQPCALRCHVKQPVVGDDDHGIHARLERLQALGGLASAAPALEVEGECDNAHGQDA